MRTAADEMAAPKYAHIERKRRWLIDAARRPVLTGIRHVLIEDRYITNARLRLRRATESQTGAVTLKLTKKYAHGEPLARPIVTTYLDAAEYDVLLALPATDLAKRRYTLPPEQGGFSIDLFEGRLAGLELAEIERPDDASLGTVQSPAWALCDVSLDSRFNGAMLALHGTPET